MLPLHARIWIILVIVLTFNYHEQERASSELNRYFLAKIWSSRAGVLALRSRRG
jgi:hypothetical protein